jgi:hypothetical protein
MRSLDKLMVAQIVKKFLAFNGTQMFITVLTKARNRSISWTNVSSPHPPPNFPKIHFILSYLRLGPPSGIFASGFPTKILYAFLIYRVRYMSFPSISSC